MSQLFAPFTLANGQVIPNRLCKAAMEENMCDAGQLPGESHNNLFGRWAKGGAGILITGNVMVSPDASTSGGVVYLDKDTLKDPDAAMRFKSWAEAAKSEGALIYMQINHPGRQVFEYLGTDVIGPSAVEAKFNAGKFGVPRAMTSDEIKAMIIRFGDTAEAAEQSGFDGVEIHAAHGFLAAQFLSPLANKRTDEWGGSLENRSRFLLALVDEVRSRVKPGFGVAIKLNSADFQKGGFDISETNQVVEWLDGKAIDFIEISGGSYESPAMMSSDGSSDGGLESSSSPKSSTELRELYFFEFAKEIAKHTTKPLMLTGGVSTRNSAELALGEDGIELVGLGRAIGLNPNLPIDWKEGRNIDDNVPKIIFKNPGYKTIAYMSMVRRQMARMAAGKAPKKLNAVFSMIRELRSDSKLTKRYKEWLTTFE